MLIASLLPAILAVVLLGAAAHLLLGLRPALAPFTAACGMMLFLLAAACLNLLLPGSVLLYLAAAAAGVFLLVRKRRAFAAYLLSPGVVAFVLGCLLLAAVHGSVGSFYHQWDDIAHWGPFYKNIKLYGALHQFTPQSMVHQAYVQGCMVFYYFSALFTPGFSEPQTFAVLGILLSACAATLTARADWKKPVSAALQVAAVPLFFVLFPYSTGYATVSLDTLMGALFGALLVLVLNTPGYSAGHTLAVALAGGALSQIKDIGMLLTLAGVVLYAGALLLDGGRPGAAGKTPLRANLNRRWLLHSLGGAAGLVPPVAWKLFLLLTHSAQDQFSSPLSGGFFGKIQAALAGADEVVPVIAEQFKIHFFHKPVVYNGLGTTALAALCFTLAGLVLGLWLWRKQHKRGPALLLFSLPLFFAAYLFSIFYTYVTMMTPQEGMTNASYERYVASFFIAWALALLAACLQLADGFPFPRLPEALPVAAASVVLALVSNMVLQQDVFNLRYTRRDAGRMGFDDVSRQMLDVMQPEEDVWVIAQGSDVLYTFMYHYTLLPARVSLSLPHTVGAPGTPTETLTPEEFAAMARKQRVEYILVYILDDDFISRYGTLFSDGLASVQASNLPSLYAVQPEAGGGDFVLRLATRQPVFPPPGPYDDEREQPENP